MPLSLMPNDPYVEQYLIEAAAICNALSRSAIADIVAELAACRDRGGRVFVLGVGGSAANASHLVNDLRSMCEIDAYAPTDNVAELTANTNDHGWHSVFIRWLTVSRLSRQDCLFILSVGGGRPGISECLTMAISHARGVDAPIVGIVGYALGATAQTAKAAAIVPSIALPRVTAHTESFQSVLSHLIVNHPLLRKPLA